MALTKDFIDDFIRVIKTLEAKHGISIQIDKVHYEHSGFTCKLNCQTKVYSPRKERKLFKKYCELANLSPSDLGQTILIQNEKYQIIGIDLEDKDFPIKLKHLGTGNVYNGTRGWLCQK